MQKLTTSMHAGQEAEFRRHGLMAQPSLPRDSGTIASLADRTLDEIEDLAAADCLSDRIDAKNFIHRYIVTLAPREERVLRLRFGLGGIGEHTLEEVGEMLGVGRERIRQIENKALRKLRYRARRIWPTCTVQSSEQLHRSCSKTSVGRSANAPDQAQTATQQSKPPLRASKPKAEGFDAAYARRTRLYRERQPERKAAIAKSVEIEIGSQSAHRRLPKLLRASAWALLALACFLVWGHTLGASGKDIFNLNFGRESGPIIRLLAWMMGYVCTPILALFARSAFEDWYDGRRSGVLKRV
jgi:hypothetical protein